MKSTGVSNCSAAKARTLSAARLKFFSYHSTICAIVFGLSAALHGGITLDKGRVQQSNFHDQPVLRIDACPAIEVALMPSSAHPEGAGEPGVPPIAPAVANAVFALTKQRLRALPLSLPATTAQAPKS